MSTSANECMIGDYHACLCVCVCVGGGGGGGGIYLHPINKLCISNKKKAVSFESVVELVKRLRDDKRHVNGMLIDFKEAMLNKLQYYAIRVV